MEVKDFKIKVAQTQATTAVGHFIASGIFTGVGLGTWGIGEGMSGEGQSIMWMVGMTIGLVGVVKVVQGFISMHESIENYESAMNDHSKELVAKEQSNG
jgi:hypothetical protein